MTELLDGMNLDGSGAVVRAVADYVDRFYNPVRLHSTRGYVTRSIQGMISYCIAADLF